MSTIPSTIPFTKAPNGQWTKKVNKKTYYFGKWATDPTGERATKDYYTRIDGIKNGLDSFRVTGDGPGWTVDRLGREFLAHAKMKYGAGEMAQRTYVDYTIEVARFIALVGGDAQVAALKPGHFTKVAQQMVAERKLGRHARKRVIAYLKAMLNWGAGNGHYPAPTYGTDFVAPDTSPAAMRQAKARAGEKDYSARIVTGEELDLLLAECPAQFRAIILLGVNCGLGPADIGRLKWSHLDMTTGRLDMARGKTGEQRVGYLWKRTREALVRCRTLKHNAKALQTHGDDALVFWTRMGLPFYREEAEGPVQAISITFGKLVKRLKLEGVTFYRLRHTFKTLGKRAKDKDALNLMMGHKEGTTGEVYDHEEIGQGRIKRVAIKVKHALWPQPKKKAGQAPAPSMRMVA